jgi:hypothetical protein
MARRLTTSNLIKEVRSLLDESNSVSISDTGDILPALNRSQDTASNILCRHYESPLLAYTLITLTTAQEYPIPRGALEQRIEKCEVQIQNGIFNPVQRVSYRDATLLETTAHTSIPMYYSEIGDRFRLYPSPTGAYPLRVWYMENPPPLVLEQGTITAIPSLSGLQVVVDAVGADLTTAVDSTNSYVNFVDGTTGAIKGSAQIQSISGRIITFRSVPTRGVVLDMPISGSLPNPPQPGPLLPLAVDDLICTVDGNCISVLKKPFANYLISMAVSELMNTKLGMANQMAEGVRKEMERIVQESWVGREQYMRVRASNNHFQRVGRRSGVRY